MSVRAAFGPGSSEARDHSTKLQRVALFPVTLILRLRFSLASQPHGARVYPHTLLGSGGVTPFYRWGTERQREPYPESMERLTLTLI